MHSELLQQLEMVFAQSPTVTVWRADNDWHFMAEALEVDGIKRQVLLAAIIPTQDHFLVKAFLGGRMLEDTPKMEDVVSAQGEVRTYRTLEKVLAVMNLLREQAKK